MRKCVEPRNRTSIDVGIMTSSIAKCTDNINRVSYERYVEEKKQHGHGKKPRLCSDNLDLLKEHINSFKKTNPALCGYCGTKPTWSVCYAKHICA
jgi:hypothetical protein